MMTLFDLDISRSRLTISSCESNLTKRSFKDQFQFRSLVFVKGSSFTRSCRSLLGQRLESEVSLNSRASTSRSGLPALFGALKTLRHMPKALIRLLPPPDNVRIEWFPANSTGFYQPTDQGIIRTTKNYYNRNWIEYIMY